MKLKEFLSNFFGFDISKLIVLIIIILSSLGAYQYISIVLQLPSYLLSMYSLPINLISALFWAFLLVIYWFVLSCLTVYVINRSSLREKYMKMKKR